MRNSVVVGLIAVVSIGLPALSSGKGDPAAGKVLYAKRCGTCHGPAGEPKEAVAKMMKVEIPHLGATEVQKKSDEDLKKAVTKGSGKMKGVQGLSDKDVADLIAYMRSLAQK